MVCARSFFLPLEWLRWLGGVDWGLQGGASSGGRERPRISGPMAKEMENGGVGAQEQEKRESVRVGPSNRLLVGDAGLVHELENDQSRTTRVSRWKDIALFW